MAGDIYGVTSFQAISASSNGLAGAPCYTFDSERSLGLYRSAASTIGVVGGSLNATLSATTIAASGFTGTPVQAMSFTTCVVPAMVVQGSASTFTVFVWPAVRAGDFIMVTPDSNPGVSSVSSGIIMHSHATINGQCELRYSNVSTLVQNQSAQTIRWLRISMA